MADLEDLAMLDASDIYPRSIKAKEVLISQKNDEFVFPVADGTAKLSGRDYEFRAPTLRREKPERSEDLSGEIQGESEESPPAGPPDDAEAHGDFWSIERWPLLSSSHWTTTTTLGAGRRNISYSTEIHWRSEVYSYWSGRHARKEDWWLLECRLKQAFVRLLEKIYEIYSIERKTSKRIYVVREGITKVQTTTRPDYVWPEVWTKIGKAAQNREKQEWSREKPKLDDARKLRGIYFIDPDNFRLAIPGTR